MPAPSKTNTVKPEASEKQKVKIEEPSNDDDDDSDDSSSEDGLGGFEDSSDEVWSQMSFLVSMIHS